jgi:CBS domain containing-hemolysin-like protein
MLLGEDPYEGPRLDLKQMVLVHQEVSKKSGFYRGELTNEQYKIIHGALDIHKHMIKTCTLPMSKVFGLSFSTVLDEQLLAEVRAKGFSRIPVYYGSDPSSAFAILLTKRLIGFDTRKKKSIEAAKLDLRIPLFVSPDESLLDLLNKFQTGHVHMAFVCEKPEGYGQVSMTKRLECVGIITLEDVLEKLLNTDFDDEFDNDKHTEHTVRHLETLQFRQRLALRMTTRRRLKHPSGNYTLMEERPLLH